MRFTGFLLILLMSATGCASSGKHPGNAHAPEAYTRVLERGDVISLEVAVRKFGSREYPHAKLWLVGAMHIGDSNYYNALQAQLDSKDLVLFEGVNTRSHPRQVRNGNQDPEDSHPHQSMKASGYSVQSELAKALGLYFQLDAIDYDRTNFVNSDLSMDQLEKIISTDTKDNKTSSAPNESLNQLMHIMDGNSFLGGIVKFGIGIISSSPKLQALTRLTLIETIGNLRGDIAEIQQIPPDLKSLLKVLIEARNQQVVDDLKLELQSIKKGRKSIAIFYGAGHMDNMEKVLGKELGFRPVGNVWMTAFAVDLKKSGVTDSEAQATRNIVEWQLKAMQTK